MKPKSLKFLSFDLYGTLLTYGDLDQSWQHWALTMQTEFERSGLDTSKHRFTDLCRSFFHGEERPEGGSTVFEKRIDRLAETLNLELSRDRVGDIADRCCAAWQTPIKLNPQSREVLEELSASYKLFLITNFDHPRHVRSVLKNHEIDSFFHEIVISGDHNIKKPNPKLFANLRDSYGVCANECAHIGDSLTDYEFSVNADLLPIMIEADGRINGEIDFQENSRQMVPARVDRISSLEDLLTMLI